MSEPSKAALAQATDLIFIGNDIYKVARFIDTVDGVVRMLVETLEEWGESDPDVYKQAKSIMLPLDARSVVSKALHDLDAKKNSAYPVHYYDADAGELLTALDTAGFEINYKDAR